MLNGKEYDNEDAKISTVIRTFNTWKVVVAVTVLSHMLQVVTSTVAENEVYSGCGFEPVPGQPHALKFCNAYGLCIKTHCAPDRTFSKQHCGCVHTLTAPGTSADDSNILSDLKNGVSDLKNEVPNGAVVEVSFATSDSFLPTVSQTSINLSLTTEIPNTSTGNNSNLVVKDIENKQTKRNNFTFIHKVTTIPTASSTQRISSSSSSSFNLRSPTALPFNSTTKLPNISQNNTKSIIPTQITKIIIPLQIFHTKLTKRGNVTNEHTQNQGKPERANGNNHNTDLITNETSTVNNTTGVEETIQNISSVLNMLKTATKISIYHNTTALPTHLVLKKNSKDLAIASKINNSRSDQNLIITESTSSHKNSTVFPPSSSRTQKPILPLTTSQAIHALSTTTTTTPTTSTTASTKSSTIIVQTTLNSLSTSKISDQRTKLPSTNSKPSAALNPGINLFTTSSFSPISSFESKTNVSFTSKTSDNVTKLPTEKSEKALSSNLGIQTPLTRLSTVHPPTTTTDSANNFGRNSSFMEIPPDCPAEVNITGISKNRVLNRSRAYGNVYIGAKGVTSNNGSLHFEGKGSVWIPFFEGNRFSLGLTIKLTFLEDVKFKTRQGLVSNCGSDASPSFSITLDPSSRDVKFKAVVMTTNVLFPVYEILEVAVPYTPGIKKTVQMQANGKRLYGRVNNHVAGTHLPSSENYEVSPQARPLYVGMGCTGDEAENFYGDINNVEVHRCVSIQK